MRWRKEEYFRQREPYKEIHGGIKLHGMYGEDNT